MIELHDVVDLWYRKSLCNGNCSQNKIITWCIWLVV